jgi:hypothetical protein
MPGLCCLQNQAVIQPHTLLNYNPLGLVDNKRLNLALCGLQYTLYFTGLRQP